MNVATKDAAEVPREGRRASGRAVGIALLIGLLGVLTAYLGFEQGGFFAGATGAAAFLVAIALVLRITLADDPLAGFGAGAVLAGAALAGLAIWTLLSQSWSDAPARALLEFNRVLLYLMVLVVMATVPRTPRRLSAGLWAFAAAATAICLAALASRVMPDLVSAPLDIQSDRLSWPLTYWNALGLLATLAIVACTHLASSEREPALARVVGAAAVPGLAVALYFTFSRGAIATAIVALAVYLVLARSRGLLSGSIAVVPATAIAVSVAYGADLLAKENPTAPIAAGQADRVAWVTVLAMVAAGALRALLLALDARLTRVTVSPGSRRAVLGGGAALAVIGALVLAVALDAPSSIERQYDRFVEGRTIESGGDLRDRLTTPANNGRLDGWRVMVDAHSLYLETLSDLGLVGMVLLGAALLMVLGAFVLRARGPDRAIYAALTAMAVAWLIHAGLDWDWEMPAVTLWLFALGGLALGARRRDRPPTSARFRAPLAVAWIVVAVAPLLLMLSASRLDGASDALASGPDCRAARAKALDSLDFIADR